MGSSRWLRGHLQQGAVAISAIDRIRHQALGLQMPGGSNLSSRWSMRQSDGSHDGDVPVGQHWSMQSTRPERQKTPSFCETMRLSGQSDWGGITVESETPTRNHELESARPRGTSGARRLGDCGSTPDLARVLEPSYRALASDPGSEGAEFEASAAKRIVGCMTSRSGSGLHWFCYDELTLPRWLRVVRQGQAGRLKRTIALPTRWLARCAIRADTCWQRHSREY